MRKLLFTTLVGLLGLMIASAASAKNFEWHGTLETKLGAAKRFNDDGSRRGVRSSGVATLNGSAGGGLLNTLRLGPAPQGNASAPVTDPDTSGTIPSVQVSGSAPGTWTFADFQSLPLTKNKRKISGVGGCACSTFPATASCPCRCPSTTTTRWASAAR